MPVNNLVLLSPLFETSYPVPFQLEKERRHTGSCVSQCVNVFSWLLWLDPAFAEGLKTVS